MQTTIITPDEARAELARLERDVAFTAGALTTAIAAFAESPGDRSAVAQLVADQKAKNALAALAAARERPRVSRRPGGGSTGSAGTGCCRRS